MTRNITPFCLTAAILVFLAPALPARADMLTYTNARFGTSVSFPAELFENRARMPENGDGILFTSADGGSLSVWSGNNALEATPASMAEEMRALEGDDLTITYEKTGKDWLVLSGFQDGLIFYQRTEFSPDGILRGFRLAYPPVEKAKYDPVISGIANSLSGPPGTSSGAQ